MDAIDLVTSWPMWEYLRAALGRSPASATRVMIASLEALLSPAAQSPATSGPGRAATKRRRGGAE